MELYTTGWIRTKKSLSLMESLSLTKEVLKRIQVLGSQVTPLKMRTLLYKILFREREVASVSVEPFLLIFHGLQSRTSNHV